MKRPSEPKTTLRRFLAVLVVLAACGGTQDGGEATPETHEPEPPGEVSWESATPSDLVALVRVAAVERIREVEPELAIDQLASWRAEPSASPALGDRVCEQLVNLAVADLVADDLDAAESTVRLIRARARNRNNAFLGSTILAEVARRRAVAAGGDARAAVRAILAEVPRGRFGMATVVYQLYQAPSQLEAQLAQIRETLLSLDTAVMALFVGEVLGPIVEARELYLSVIDEVRASHAERPPEPDFDFSTVDLSGARDARPVLVGVWDTGVATSLFEGQLFTNEAEQPNGEDDDGNGLVDDAHGVVSDPDPEQAGLLYEPGAETVERYAPFLRGIMDLRAGISTSEAAQRVLTLMRSVADAGALEELQRSLGAIGEWAHGTHVAGITLAGVPQARLAVFRSAWAAEQRIYWQRGPTDEELAAERENVEAIASFIRSHGVRVVNASLGFSVDYLESELRHQSDVYTTDEAVRARAREIHAHRVANWRWIFEQCPETLFVVAAGNSNRDVLEYNDVPAALEAPNVLPVGAVDRHGSWAIFTNSSPGHVRVFDLGVEVDSVIPNGERVPLSGTSMAAPNVANLAAKLLALDPSLTPSRLVEIIHETGDPIEPPFSGRIANEGRAVELVRRARAR